MKTDRPANGDARSASVAMLLTAPQPAAIAVIRLDGPAVKSFAERHLSKPPVIGRCVYCDLKDGDEIIDDIVAVLVADDRIDLNLHGGEWVTEAALRLAERAGFSIIPWHADSALASDAASAIEAEVAAALPYAATREALAILLAQPAAWEKMLVADDRAAMRRASEDRAIERILTPPRVAIVGEPNAGKSTLINRLAGQARSITADIPGTTRDYVTAPANIGGLIVHLIDTPGARSTTDAIEAAAIARSTDVIATADVILELRDATHPPQMPHPEWSNAIVVWNKCDRATPPGEGIQISAATGQGIDALAERIHAALRIDDLHSPHARCWTPRQRNLISGPSPSGRG